MITFVVCFLLLDNFNYGAEKKTSVHQAQSMSVVLVLFLSIFIAFHCVFFLKCNQQQKNKYNDLIFIMKIKIKQRNLSLK